MLLRDALADFVRDWRRDLPDGWGRALESVEPDVAAVAGDLPFAPEAPIFPARRAAPLPAARADAHVFRAFDELQPADVRCVLLGQDPYPRIARATGRSFEQGDVRDWRSGSISDSLKALVPMVAEWRTGDDSYRREDGFERAVDPDGSVAIEPPRALFDRWQGSGVLCLNAALTLTRFAKGGAPEQLKGHIPFWAPVIGHVMRHLAETARQPVVILLLGRPARDLADSIGVRAAAEAAGTWGSRVAEVRLSHPASDRFPEGDNPFVEVNRRLVEMGGQAIAW